jgi:hypothetical protein
MSWIFLLPTDKYCSHAGGLFYFRKDQDTHTIDPADYPKKPLFGVFAAATDNRLLNKFFLLVLPHSKMCTDGKASEPSSLRVISPNSSRS